MNSNSLDDVLQKRRSIRRYTADMPPDRWIEAMVAAATYAPSPSNSQPVRILRIVSKEKREALHQALIDGRRHLLAQLAAVGGPKRVKNRINGYYRFSEFLANAPLLFAFGVIKATTGGFSRKLQEAGLVARDLRHSTDMDITVGLALKGFILKAADLGLGTCILTAPLVFIENIETVLDLTSLRIACLVTAGFPDEIPAGISKKSTAEIYGEI